MAIAEVAARVGIFTKAAEAKPLVKETLRIEQIKPFTPEEASDLANRYLLMRWLFQGKSLDSMSPSEAIGFGVMEIQGIVLGMLGHSPLLQDRAAKLYTSQNFTPQIYNVLDLEKDDIAILAERYRTARKLSIKGEFARRVWTNKVGKELKPQEARIQGNMFELVALLEQLEQGELVKAIDKEVPDPNEVDFRGNRISTGGELQ